MAFDPRWKNPPGPEPQQLYLWAQNLITELRRGQFIPAPQTAADVSYDNDASGLAADDVQEAIDEVEGRVDDLEASLQLAKAWVTFNGTGTPAIIQGFNVASITDNGVGDYTINFTVAFTTANYVVVTGMQPAGNISVPVCRPNTQNTAGAIAASAPTTTACRVTVGDSGAAFRDHTAIHLAFFGA